MSRTRGARWVRGDRGTAGLEFIALVPLLLFVGLLALQAGAVGLTAVSTTEAVREAARARTLGHDPLTVARDSLPGALEVDVNQLQFNPATQRMTLQVDVPQLVPGFSYTISRSAVMPVTTP